MGHWEWDIFTDTMNWSPGMYRILGIEEHLKPSLDLAYNIVHPDDQPAFQTALNNVLDGKPVVGFDLKCIRPNGDLFYVHLQYEATCDYQGRPLKLFGTLQDITERKRTDAALHRFELMATHSRDIILFMRRDNGRHPGG